MNDVVFDGFLLQKQGEGKISGSLHQTRQGYTSFAKQRPLPTTYHLSDFAPLGVTTAVK